MPTALTTAPVQPAAEVPDPLAARPSASPVRRGDRGRAVLRRARGWSHHLASEIGQGTVEYVGLLLLMATLLAAVVGASKELGGKNAIGKKVVDNISTSIDKAGGNSDR